MEAAYAFMSHHKHMLHEEEACLILGFSDNPSSKSAKLIDAGASWKHWQKHCGLSVCRYIFEAIVLHLGKLPAV